MDLKKLNGTIQVVKEDLADGLISTDIWSTADGKIIAGFNSQPKAAALLNRIGKQLIDSIKIAKFAPFDKYYALDLHDDKLLLCLTFDDYWWGMLLDAKKVPLGLLLNIVVPKAIEGFNEALSG